MRKKLCLLVMCMAVSFVIAGCGNSSSDKSDTKTSEEGKNEKTSNKSQEEDIHVKAVRQGSPKAYPNIKYGDAFGEFFDEANWRYFKAKKGQDIVEFTGYCTYKESRVKARLQFVVDMDNGSFTQGALSFNDVPQEDTITSVMILKAFEDYAENHNVDEEDVDKNSFESGTVTQFDNSEETSTPEPEVTPEPEPTPEEEVEDSYDYYDDEEDSEDDTDYYILPNSDTKKVTKVDLKSLTKEQCRIARNEIYARHGRRFNDKELQDYFDKQSWYFGSVEADEFSESVLNPIEKANAKFILKYENKLK